MAMMISTITRLPAIKTAYSMFSPFIHKYLLTNIHLIALNSIDLTVLTDRIRLILPAMPEHFRAQASSGQICGDDFPLTSGCVCAG
jgi:hypothetical protein